MFEKEAEKHADGIYHYKINVSDYEEDGIINYRYSDVKEAYQKGAEFGYNKANEWHYPSKGEYPDNDSDILCQIDFETFEVGYFNENYNNFFTIDGKEIEVKAWKEIVLPELKESE